MPIPHGRNGFDASMNFIYDFSENLWSKALLLLLIAIMIASCVPTTPSAESAETPSPTSTEAAALTPTQTSTPRPTPTPTTPPIGGPGNPITIGFVLVPEDSAAIEAAEDIAFWIEQDTGYRMESLIYPDFESLSSAVMRGDVDLFWLDPLEYLHLNWEASAQVILVTNHLGVYAYGVQFMANTLRGFTSYYNADTGTSLGDPVSALQQFAGTRPCFTDSESLPGYFVPLGLLANTSTPTLPPVFTFSYDAIIRALYIQGICDFGVSYALTGDPRTSSDILLEIPDAQERVVIIWQSEGIIPNTNLSASPNLPLHIRHRLQESVLDLADDTEGLMMINTALDYEVSALKTVQDSFYNPFRAAIIPLELDLKALTHQTDTP